MFRSFGKNFAARGRRLLPHHKLKESENIAFLRNLGKTWLKPKPILGVVVVLSSLGLLSNRRVDAPTSIVVAPKFKTEDDEYPTPLQQLMGRRPTNAKNIQHKLIVEKLDEKLSSFKNSLEASTMPRGNIAQGVPVAPRLATPTAPAADGTPSTASPSASPKPSTPPARVFVLTFKGDVFASQVEKLREEVTAVTQNASPDNKDEVVLLLHSPGGTVTGYGLAAAQLDRIKRAGLRLTVCVDEVAASGGYMMAAVGDEIVASPFAVIGSIGVVATQPNFKNLLDKIGVQVNDVTSGKWKRTMVPYKEVTPEDREKVQEDIDMVQKEFKAHLTAHRAALNVDEVATGETWFGQEALSRKLIDSIGTSDDMLLTALKKGKEVYHITYQKQKRTWMGWVPVTSGDQQAESGPRSLDGLADGLAWLVTETIHRVVSNRTPSYRRDQPDV